MSPEEFVDALKTEVFDAALADVAALLRSGPPARSPGNRAVVMHDWFAHLPEHDQALVLEVARDAAHATLFGMLSALDGARMIDDPPHERLVLTSMRADGTGTLLNPEGDELHDRLNALVHPPSEACPPG